MPPTNLRIFHIADQEAWNRSGETGIYFPPDFETDQFIHCCMLEQLPGVLSRYFKDQDSIIVLELESDRMAEFLRFENLENGSELFPHFYAPLRVTNVKHVTRLHRKENEEFDLAFL